MLYVVHVTFLPGCSLSPDDFFQRVNARWRWVENPPDGDGNTGAEKGSRAAVCIADFESIEQFAIDVSVAPGGIANIEVEPLPEMSDLPSVSSR